MTRMRPYLVGLIMGPMMLWMMHDAIAAGSAWWAAAGFVAAHLLVLALALAILLVVPRWRARLAAVHRPSLPHMGAMLGSAGAAAGLVHLIHGGPL